LTECRHVGKLHDHDALRLGAVMNTQRGMFRLWVLFTIFWLICCGLWAYQDATSTWLRPETYVLQAAASGALEFNPHASTVELRKTHNEFPMPQHGMTLFVPTSIPKETAEKRAKAFYDAHLPIRLAELRNRKTERLVFVAATAIAMPIGILIIAYAFGWAFFGHSQRGPDE
jgi:hypothetical protein